MSTVDMLETLLADSATSADEAARQAAEAAEQAAMAAEQAAEAATNASNANENAEAAADAARIAAANTTTNNTASETGILSQKLSRIIEKVDNYNTVIAGYGDHLTNTSNPHQTTAAQVGAVPSNRQINGKALSNDINLTATDVGARPNSWTPTVSDIGAASNDLSNVSNEAFESKLESVGGGSGKGNPSTGWSPLIYENSDTFTPVYSGVYEVTCIGKGGNGYWSSQRGSTFGGGGGGGFCRSLLQLQSGTSYTITIDNSKSSFSGNGITTMIANAGGNGSATAGGTGGTATGGNLVNIAGGNGGRTSLAEDGGCGGGGGSSYDKLAGGNGTYAGGGGSGRYQNDEGTESKGSAGKGVNAIWPIIESNGESNGNGAKYGGGGGANNGSNSDDSLGGIGAVIIRG